jgi:arylsulfatase A-like enzyme
MLIAGVMNLVPGNLRAQSSPRLNVILISLDQLRADQVHSLGNPRLTTPNLDRLAEQGVRFSHFYSVAPWTAPSYSSLMTSLYPSMHGVTLMWRPGDPLVNANTPMLAEIFKAHGYHTAAFVNNGVAGKALTGRGFDEYDQGQPNGQVKDITQRGGEAFNLAPETTQRLMPWLDQHRSEPFFLFVLYLEPHSPYNPPPEDDIFKTNAYPDETNTGYDLQRGHLFRLAMLGDQQAVQRLYDLYDGKIHFVDRYVGELMDHLKQIGLSDNTLVVLTSDHGEMLYSHPDDLLTFDHRSLYDPVMHVPLIMAGPGLPKGKLVDALASNVDTAPTILNLAGFAPPPNAEGHSLLPLIEGKVKSVNKYVYGEEDVVAPLRSVRTDQYKLIENLWTGKIQLFDLSHDPGEMHDLYGHGLGVQADLLRHLHEWMVKNHSSIPERMTQWRRYAQDPWAKELVTDDQTIGGHMLITGGGWHSDESPTGASYGGGCLWTEGGDGTRTATWRVDNPLIGEYKIYAYYGHPSVGALATNARFTIGTDGDAGTATVDFSHGAGDWSLLGTFKNPRYVQLSNAANGAVLADAVKFVRVGE